MKPSEIIRCENFPCEDVDKQGFTVPSIDISPETISLVMISESAPSSFMDYFYAGGNSSFAQTTLTAFNDAGIHAAGFNQLLDLGIYFTTAVKCTKRTYGIETATVKTCAGLLEKELALFPNLKVYLLMGDVAIKALNSIAVSKNEPRVIPSGSTYKIRGQKYFYKGIRVFPSYLQVGPSFNIEKS